VKKRPGIRALYNNLMGGEAISVTDENTSDDYKTDKDKTLEIAIRIDDLVKANRPDAWRGVQAREQVIKAQLYKVLQDEAEVERIFPIIKAQAEY
jgi:type I restriction enzyme R subunit